MPWLTKERLAVRRRREPRTTRAALVGSGLGERRPYSWLLLIRHWPWADASQEFPACRAHSLRCRTTPTSGRERYRAWWPKYLIGSDGSERRPVLAKCQQDFEGVVIIVGRAGSTHTRPFRRIIMAATKIWGCASVVPPPRGSGLIFRVCPRASALGYYCSALRAGLLRRFSHSLPTEIFAIRIS